jgi:hypothetical protein
MFFAIVLTANHYIIDAAAGGVVALTGLAVSYVLFREEPAPESHQRARNA